MAYQQPEEPSTHSDREQTAVATYEDVMTVPFIDDGTPFNRAATLEYEFGHVWNRPLLSRRDRRLITLTCAGGADSQDAILAHVYAALNSGDLSYESMLEFVLHFAVYCGWPKASFLNMVVQQQQIRICEERGTEPPSRQPMPAWEPTLNSEARIRGGEECFQWINCVDSPPRDTPYTLAGIFNFVFGEVWQRPGLTGRDRRIMTVAAVGLDDTMIPIRSHVYAALKSGDVSLDEMRELVLHFAVYSGWPKASFLNQVATESWERIESEGGVRVGDPPSFH